MLKVYVLRLSTVRMYVVRVLALFALSRVIQGIGNLLRNYLIL